MLPGLNGRSLQFPLIPIGGRHENFAEFLRVVLAPVGNPYNEVFAPLSAVMYGKL